MVQQNDISIAILLPVYNHLEYTRISLDNLKKNTKSVLGCILNTILIDDGSSDGTSDWVKINFPDIKILQGNGNLWWSGAINLGASYAINELNVDYILLWNNDIKAGSDYFSNLSRIVHQYDQDSVIGSKILIQEDPGMVWSMGGYFQPKTGKYDMYGYYEKDSELFNKIYSVDWLTGMGTIIPKKVIQTIGYWDNKNFPQYHGDSDFTYRAKLKGFKILVDPSLKIYNSVKSSGLEHKGSYRNLLKLITDIRSKSNLSKNMKFYRLYATSLRAYIPLIGLYFKIFGGFFKWKLLSLFGKKNKKNTGV